MDESNTTPRTVAATDRKRGRGMLWGLLAVVIAFLVGFGWQFYRATTIEDRLAETEQQLRVERIRVRLAQAAISAQSGDYENARRTMSELFTTLQTEAALLPPDVQAAARGFLARRDEIITGLSRSNPEFAAVLYGMLDRLRSAAEPATGPPAGPDAAPEPAEAQPGEAEGAGPPPATPDTAAG